MAEKKEFKELVKSGQRTSKELNFDEALKNIYKTYSSQNMSSNVLEH